MAVPIAIAMPKVTTAKGCLRAIEKLIVDTAMIRTIRPAGEILRRAVIAELPWQLFRNLPVDARQQACFRQSPHLKSPGRRSRNNCGKKNCQHRPKGRHCGTSSDAIGSIASGGDSFTMPCLIGRRTVKREP